MAIAPIWWCLATLDAPTLRHATTVKMPWKMTAHAHMLLTSAVNAVATTNRVEVAPILESCNYDPAATVDDGSCIVAGIELTLTLLTDNYPNETTWSVVDASGNTMAAGGPYSNQQTSYVEEFCVGSGCFDLIFNDTYGDGMQAGGVAGDYQLTDPDGNVLVQIVSGANFGLQAIDNFCVESQAILGCTNPEACNLTIQPRWMTVPATTELLHTPT